MTPGTIWGVMLRKKVFQQWEVVEELAKMYSYLPKRYIRMRVQEMVKIQSQNGTLVKVHENPDILAVSKYSLDWERYYTTYYTCEVCGKKFIPSMPHQKVCSKECKHEHQVRLCREYRRPSEERKRNRKHLPWTKEEEKEILKAFPGLRYSKTIAQNLSLKLRRSPEAIRRRLYQLRRGAER